MVAETTTRILRRPRTSIPLGAGQALPALLALCVVITALVALAPGVGFSSPRGDAALDTLGGSATLLATALAVARFHAVRSRASLVLALALAFQSASTLLLVTVPELSGVSTGSWLGHARGMISLVGAALLMWAAFAAPSPTRLSTSGWRPVALVAAMSLAAGALSAAIGAILPGFDVTRGAHAGARLGGLAAEPSLFVLGEAATATMWAIAAAGFAMRVPRVAPRQFGWWLTITCALAAGARIDNLLIGPEPSSWVSLADVLRAASMLALAAGVVRELECARRREHDRAVQEERGRLARELHDGVAQELAFILGQSRRLAKIFPEERALADIGTAAEHALHDSRAAIYGLQESTSPTLGAAIEARAHELAGRAGLELTLSVAEDIVSSAEVEHGVLSILQEAISNAARHGNATKLRISLRARGDTVLVGISDDGRGFEPKWRAPSRTGGFGLRSMHERAKALGGELSLESAPGRGTTIELAVE
jgi:signal transduction histidine kinase